ncbi:DUF669 domain-containing protein [Enterococcus bulliens]
MAEQKFDWTKFDKKVDLNALKNDVKEAEKNGGGDFPEIPDGKYEVKVKNMELGQSKIKENGTGGDPMLKIQFEILAGEFKGNLIFYNGVMQPGNEIAFGFQVHRNNEMLRNLWDADHDEVDFNGFADYADLVLDIAEEIIEDEWNYVLDQSTNTKNPNFKNYEIVEILD